MNLNRKDAQNQLPKNSRLGIPSKDNPVDKRRRGAHTLHVDWKTMKKRIQIVINQIHNIDCVDGLNFMKVETKNRKKNSEEAESFEIHGPKHFKGCPACQGVTDEHSYGPGCRLKKQ